MLLTSLGAVDLEACAVWEYVNSDSDDEMTVRPVTQKPAETLGGRVVGCQVRLANGNLVWGLVGNVAERDARSTEHFLLLSVLRGGRWFTLARYHDLEYGEHGPAALARFLELQLNEVFPIAYDIRAYAKGESTALAGSLYPEPRERLSKAELVALALP